MRVVRFVFLSLYALSSVILCEFLSFYAFNTVILCEILSFYAFSTVILCEFFPFMYEVLRPSASFVSSMHCVLCGCLHLCFCPSMNFSTITLCEFLSLYVSVLCECLHACVFLLFHFFCSLHAYIFVPFSKGFLYMLPSKCFPPLLCQEKRPL